MKQTRQLAVQPRRHSWVEINLGALERNALRLKALLPSGTELMAVLKADAYGHSAVGVWPVLQASGVSALGVASVDEGVQLREAGVELPILVLGPVPDWAMPMAATYDIALAVFSPQQWPGLQAAYAQTGKTVLAHIKVDTGMHRVGVATAEAVDFWQGCLALGPALTIKGIFTHLACGEDEAKTLAQWQLWQNVLSQISPLPGGLPPVRHVVNTDGLFSLQETLKADAQAPEALRGSTMGRLGIGLFGYLPGQPQQANALGLEPVMGLKARIAHLQTLPAGEGVSYGHRFVTQRPTVLATLPLGYADGVPRGLSGQLQAQLNGQTVPQVGTITMDQLLLDVTDCPSVQVGDTVTLLGDGLTLTHWTQTLNRHALNTLEYELMCGLRVRLPRVYTR